MMLLAGKRINEIPGLFPARIVVPAAARPVLQYLRTLAAGRSRGFTLSIRRIIMFRQFLSARPATGRRRSRSCQTAKLRMNRALPG
jgi:hypothetical protein